MAEKIHRNSLKPDHQLHWYRIIKILGQGGFGITYLAHDINLDKEVAIKEYLPIEMAVREGDFSVHPVSEDHSKQYKWGLDRFITEARTLAKFNHPNIVRVLSVFEENNTGYMVMQYEHGHSLQEKLAGRKTMEEAELLKILVPILGGLEQIHKAGFIHRDIKPDNIFIRDDGSPVLLDFGSARHALGEKTKTLTSLVTPGYAPFEQYYSKSDEQGPWTDIYGLGSTLYRAITGVAPMDALDRSKAILEASHDTVVSAEEVGKAKYSSRFLKAIDHAIQFRIKDRPQSIAEWKGEFGIAGDMVGIEHLEQQENLVTQPGTRIIRKKSAPRMIPLIVVTAVILLLIPAVFMYRSMEGNRIPAGGQEQGLPATTSGPEINIQTTSEMRVPALSHRPEHTPENVLSPPATGTLSTGSDQVQLQEESSHYTEPPQKTAVLEQKQIETTAIEPEVPEIPVQAPASSKSASVSVRMPTPVATPPDLTDLDYEEVVAIQTACAYAQNQGQEIYFKCMKDQLQYLEDEDDEEYEDMTEEENLAMQAQMMCAYALGQGQAAYAQCLEQFTAMNIYNAFTDDIDEELTEQIESACSYALNQGPVEYTQCLYSQIQSVYSGIDTTGGEEYGVEELNTIKAACAPYLNQAPALYNQCLFEQLRDIE